MPLVIVMWCIVFDFKLGVHDFIHIKKMLIQVKGNYMYVSISVCNISSKLALIFVHEHVGSCSTKKHQFACN